MRVAVTGATGLIGRALVGALKQRGDEVVAISRDPQRAGSDLSVRAIAPDAPLESVDAAVNLAGEPVAQRWSADTKQRIRDSRVQGTTRLVEAIRAGDPGPRVLVSTSAAGYYGHRGNEILNESSTPGDDFLASVCVAWEQAAAQAPCRVVVIRNGVVLDAAGGAMKQLLGPFKLGVGGPVAGGRQYMPWIALEDTVGLYLAALDDERYSGPVNGCAPHPVTNAEFSRALGHTLHRPAVMPVPAFALKLRFGEMAQIVLDSQRMAPARAQELGYQFRYPELPGALSAALNT